MSDREDKRIVAERFADADLAADRFINVNDGEKGTHDHGTRHSDPRDVPGVNYGIYAGGGFVALDKDDYSTDTDDQGLAAVRDLSETLGAVTPHTDGDPGGHDYYHVTTERSVDDFDTDAVLAGVAERTADAAKDDPVALALAEAFGTPNPQPSWGEVRAVNQYVVGPGSELDSCDKEWHDCSDPGEGRYTIATDAPIATIAVEDLIDALRADPDLPSDDNPTTDTDDSLTCGGSGTGDYDPAGTSFETLVEHEPDVATYLAVGAEAAGFEAKGGGDDRSRADWRVCCLAVEYGVPEQDVRDRLADCPHSKVGAGDGPRDYWERTWSKAVNEVNANSKIPDIEPTQTHQEAYQAEKEAYNATTDAEKAFAAWNILRNDIDVIAVQPSGELYACHDGVWTNDGKQVLREGANELMGTDFSKNVLTELCEKVRAENAVNHDRLGVPPDTIAVENGLLSFEEREVRDLEPEDFALARLPVKFDPNATCPNFKKFLGEVCRPEDIPKIQEFVGYCLEHWTAHHKKALMLFGPTDSGKTVFCTVVEELFGEENTAGVSPQYLANERWGIADLEGKVVNVRHDLDPGVIQKPGPLKELVSGDRVMAERKNQDPFPLRPTAKHLWAANRAPQINQEDEALLNRFLIGEFPRTIPKDEQTNREVLLTELVNELPGILNWALDGLERLREQGQFTDARFPGEIAEMWKAYGESVEQFIEQCTEEVDDGEGKIHASTVHEVYVRYARSRDLEVQSQSKLTRELKNAGFRYGSPRIDGKKNRGFFNLRLTDAAPEPSGDDESRSEPGVQSSLG